MIPNGYNTPPSFLSMEKILAGINSIGTDFMVDTNAGLDTNDGLSWESAMKTLAVAIAASNVVIAAGASGWANRNRIFYKGDNAEAAAETITTLPSKCDVIGVGSYDHRPGPMLIGNHVIGAGAYMGTHFYNMGFASPASGGVILAIPTTTSGVVFDKSCWFDGRSAVAATKAIVAVGVEQLRIEGCKFIGKYSTTTIEIGTGSCRGLLIKNNEIESGAIGITVDIGATCADAIGMILNNVIKAVTLVIDENSDKMMVIGNQGCTAAAQTLALIIDYNSALACNNTITSATVTSIYPALGAIA